MLFRPPPFRFAAIILEISAAALTLPSAVFGAPTTISVAPLSVVMADTSGIDSTAQPLPSAVVGARPSLSALMADASAVDSTGAMPVYLEVTLNGEKRGLASFSDRQGKLFASAATLKQLGIYPPASTPDPVELSSLDRFEVSYDPLRQSVAIIAPLSALRLPTQVISTGGSHGQSATGSTGLALNYDLYGTQTVDSSSSLGEFVELRAFGDYGLFTTSGLSQQYASESESWQHRVVRLDTLYSYSWPDSLRTLNIGDTLTNALSWSRGTRIGGLQYGRNFSLQPYLQTSPVPVFLGSSTMPSTAELFVNGVRQYSGDLPAGPFQFNALPGINGTGNAQVVLTDALGRTQTINFSFYNETDLLKAGLSDWSAELGLVRQGYGIVSSDYGDDPVASATWRHGMSDFLTLEAHGEATSDLVNGGGGGHWNSGGLGVFSVSAAGSSSRDVTGSQVGLGYTYANGSFNFGAHKQRTFDTYLDAASPYDSSRPPRESGNAWMGYHFGWLGAFGLSIVDLQYDDQESARYATASWFKSFGRNLSLNASLNHDLEKSNETSFFLTLSWALGDRTTMRAGLQHDGEGKTLLTADASCSTPSEGGWGWQVGAVHASDEEKNSGGGQGRLEYLGRYGRTEAGYYGFNGSEYGFGSFSGGLALMEGKFFASQRLDNAFALVSASGVEGVPVTLENRDIGTTDRNGMALVTPLNAYQDNKIGIDTMQLPADLRVDTVKAVATPRDRAGVLVNFGITPVRAATIIVVDDKDQHLPLGSQVIVNGQNEAPVIVGFDGMVYSDTLATENELHIQLPTGEYCRVSFTFTEESETIPQIGPFRCMKEERP